MISMHPKVFSTSCYLMNYGNYWIKTEFVLASTHLMNYYSSQKIQNVVDQLFTKKMNVLLHLIII